MNTSASSRPALERGPLLLIMLGRLVLNLAANVRYDFFRDELYYIQWSERLAWGYAEQPPFVAFVIYLTRALFGHSLFALRLPPALTGAAIVLLAGLMAREMGGRRYAQTLAALCVAAGPIFLGTAALSTMDPYNQLFSVMCLYLLVRYLRTSDTRLWLWFGAVAGLGLLNKLSMPFLGAALLPALLLTPHRRLFLCKHFWAGGLIAFAVFSPFLVWLAANDWATLEFMLNYGGGSKTFQAGFFHWLYMQIVSVHPLTLPVWLAGLYGCLATEAGRPFRAVGWLFLTLYFLFFALKAKFYFLAPAFPMLLAAGSVLIERRLENPRARPWRLALPVLLVAGGLVAAPLAIPILPVDALLRYTAVLGGNAGIRTEQLEEAELPQHFADQFGWREMVAGLARVYETLDPAEQAECAIFTQNYGQAAAVDFYGPAHGLPSAISGHGTYYLWGPGDATGKIVLAVIPESGVEDYRAAFEELTVVARNECGLCIPHERATVFAVCRRSRAPLADLWPMVKHFD